MLIKVEILVVLKFFVLGIINVICCGFMECMFLNCDGRLEEWVRVYCKNFINMVFIIYIILRNEEIKRWVI